MIDFYKEVENGYIVGIGRNGNSDVSEISETEYNEILAAIQNIPVEQAGYSYLLRADTLEWETVELQPNTEEIDSDEAMAIIFGLN